MRWMAEPSQGRDRPLQVVERVCFFDRKQQGKNRNISQKRMRPLSVHAIMAASAGTMGWSACKAHHQAESWKGKEHVLLQKSNGRPVLGRSE